MPEQARAFSWTTFDVRARLPVDWQSAILEVARTASRSWHISPTSITSREARTDLHIDTLTVGGVTLRERLPWLASLYESEFLVLARQTTSVEVVAAQDPRYGVVLNIQRGSRMRYECHVDSNPLEGLLYATSHPQMAGGELVVSNVGDVASCEEVDMDCSVIYPQAGHLVFFDAHDHAHYVRSLHDEDAWRVVVAMNYYTPALPESARPTDLNRHLFGED